MVGWNLVGEENEGKSVVTLPIKVKDLCKQLHKLYSIKTCTTS
jgi:hypothetical protein